LVDRWVHELGAPARTEFTARLRDYSSEAPRSAFYELAVGRVLLGLGKTQYEPDTLPCAGKPDWLVAMGPRKVVVEVATLEEAATLDEKRRKDILCKVAELTGPWWVFIDWRNSPGIESIRPRAAKDAVARGLAAIGGPLPQDLSVAAGSCRIALRVFAKHTREGTVIGADATRSVRINPGEDAIKDRVTKKAKRYRGLKKAGIPLVVAVCTDDPLVDTGNFFNALFGRPQITFSLSTPLSPPSLAPGGLDAFGLLTPGPGGVIATTVSEVWFVKRSGIRGRLALTITRAPNPWAENPLDWRPSRMATIHHKHLKNVTRFRIPRRIYRIPLDSHTRADESPK
jgi:hypothetical protein